MSLDHDPQAVFEFLPIPHTHGFSHQAGDAVSPFVVESFDHAGLSLSFSARPVLPGRKPFGIRLVKVGINQLAPIRGGHHPPQLLQRLLAAIVNDPGQHLMRQARHHQPQIPIPSFEAIAHHQLVDLQRIALDRFQQRAGKTYTALLRLFLSTVKTVARPQLNDRAMARCESRSPSAFSIKACFSALRRRPGPSGVHVLRHSLQRSRCRPPSVKPKRTTASHPWQCAHAKTFVTIHQA